MSYLKALPYLFNINFSIAISSTPRT